MIVGPDTWVPAHIGLGSNLSDPVAQLHRAIRSLSELESSRLIAVSSLYRSPPLGPPDQPDYVNAVAAILTQMSPTDLMPALQNIERNQGRLRDRAQRWGPRIIDLDILTYGARVVDLPELQIPHPGISDRNFVLFPLAELAPDLEIPGCGIVRNLALNSDRTTLKLITE